MTTRGGAQLSMTSDRESRDVSVEGTIERFTFRNPDSGWAVLRLAEESTGKMVTAVGPMAQLKEGQRLRIRGEVDTHPKFGEQRPKPLVDVPNDGGEDLVHGLEHKMHKGPLRPRVSRLLGEGAA